MTGAFTSNIHMMHLINRPKQCIGLPCMHVTEEECEVRNNQYYQYIKYAVPSESLISTCGNRRL